MNFTNKKEEYKKKKKFFSIQLFLNYFKQNF